MPRRWGRRDSRVVANMVAGTGAMGQNTDNPLEGINPHNPHNPRFFYGAVRINSLGWGS